MFYSLFSDFSTPWSYLQIVQGNSFLIRTKNQQRKSIFPFVFSAHQRLTSVNLDPTIFFLERGFTLADEIDASI